MVPCKRRYCCCRHREGAGILQRALRHSIQEDATIAKDGFHHAAVTRIRGQRAALYGYVLLQLHHSAIERLDRATGIVDCPPPREPKRWDPLVELDAVDSISPVLVPLHLVPMMCRSPDDEGVSGHIGVDHAACLIDQDHRPSPMVSRSLDGVVHVGERVVLVDPKM